MSLSKAAKDLYITQPSLSKYLKKLEDEIGAKLFSRDNYPIKLTMAGELYLKYIMDSQERERRLLHDIREIKEHISGKIIIGITPWRSSIVMPKILPSYLMQNPLVHVELLEGDHSQLYTLLEHDEVDFCILNSPMRFHNVVFEHITHERILLAVSISSPLLRNLPPSSNNDIGHIGHTNCELLENQSFIMLKSAQNLRMLTQNYLNKNHLSPSILIETANIITAINMAAVGLGITFVPEWVLWSKHQVKDLAFFTLDDPVLSWELGIAYNVRRPLGKAAISLMHHVKRYFI
jgi:LysR family transcriptional activator of glutamate synthase operon